LVNILRNNVRDLFGICLIIIFMNHAGGLMNPYLATRIFDNLLGINPHIGALVDIISSIPFAIPLRVPATPTILTSPLLCFLTATNP